MRINKKDVYKAHPFLSYNYDKNPFIFGLFDHFVFLKQIRLTTFSKIFLYRIS